MKTIRNHVDHLFRDVPENEETLLMKEEIIENLEEKVDDLIREGKSQEDAMNKAIVEFGDISEIEQAFQEEESKPAPHWLKKSQARLNLEFSLWGSALLITLFAFINFYYTPTVIWFVYPTFGVLWWPLSLFFHWRKQKGGHQ